MKIHLEKIFSFIKENNAYSITIANLFLILILLITKDPFELRSNTYEKAKPFLSANLSQVTKIELEKTKLQNSKFELVKESDSWSIKKDGKQIPADGDKIESLIKSFLNAKKFTLVSSSKEKNDEFGFNEDELKIEFFNANSSIGYFYIGNSGKDGKNSNVKFKDSNDIFLVEDNLKSHTGRGDINHFFNKRISPIDLNNDSFISIELESSSNSYKINKNTVWNLDSPQKGEISTEDMNTTLNKLTSMNADDILLDESLVRNLESNSFSIRVNFKDKDSVPKIFTIQSVGFDRKNNAYYVRKNNERTIFKLSEYAIKSILDWKPSKLVKQK